MHYRHGILTGWLFCSLGLQSAETLTIKTEKGTSPTGPWTLIQPAQGDRDNHGNAVLTAGESREYFRTRIERTTVDPVYEPVPLAKIPSDIVRTAEDQITQFSSALGTNGFPTEPELWSGVKLGPTARPVYEPTILEGVAPAYWEFKVIVATPLSVSSRGGFITRQSAATTPDLGYIIVSATDEDTSVPEFATEGRSPLDELADRAGTTAFKAFRFGGTFYTAEDAGGKVLATFGSPPFQPSGVTAADLAKVVTYKGDDDTQVYDHLAFPKFAAQGYPTYLEFRQDYVKNPVFQQLKARRVARARARWGSERGLPVIPVVSVRVGATVEETNAVIIKSVRLVAEDPDIARLSFSARAPKVLGITGVQVGTGKIEIVDTAGTHYLTLSVSTLAIRPLSDGSFLPGWRTKKTYWAGSWADQPKFYQLERNEWCPAVGCGPVAWGMLFAWFEVNRNIPAAFGDWFAFDVDLTMNEYSKSYIDTWRILHSACGSWCVPASDSSATWPGDMMDGGANYTWGPKALGLIKRSYEMEYDLAESGVAEHALLCRDAIVKGYPAVVGLGWLWHYALTYGVKYQELEALPGYFVESRRILKCNMGYGPGHSAKWYDLNDTFFGADFKISKGSAADAYPPLNSQ